MRRTFYLGYLAINFQDKIVLLVCTIQGHYHQAMIWVLESNYFQMIVEISTYPLK